jgi:hypothetical protein
MTDKLYQSQVQVEALEKRTLCSGSAQTETCSLGSNIDSIPLLLMPLCDQGSSISKQPHAATSVPKPFADKVSQNVWSAIHQHRHPSWFPATGGLTIDFGAHFDDRGNIQVYVYTNGRADEHLSDFERLGIEVTGTSDGSGMHRAVAWVSLQQIRKLAKRSWVRSIELPRDSISRPNP